VLVTLGALEVGGWGFGFGYCIGVVGKWCMGGGVCWGWAVTTVEWRGVGVLGPWEGAFGLVLGGGKGWFWERRGTRGGCGGGRGLVGKWCCGGSLEIHLQRD